jgi:hypothetical protein
MTAAITTLGLTKDYGGGHGGHDRLDAHPSGRAHPSVPRPRRRRDGRRENGGEGGIRTHGGY